MILSLQNLYSLLINLRKSNPLIKFIIDYHVITSYY